VAVGTVVATLLAGRVTVPPAVRPRPPDSGSVRAPAPTTSSRRAPASATTSEATATGGGTTPAGSTPLADPGTSERDAPAGAVDAYSILGIPREVPHPATSHTPSGELPAAGGARNGHRQNLEPGSSQDDSGGSPPQPARRTAAEDLEARRAASDRSTPSSFIAGWVQEELADLQRIWDRISEPVVGPPPDTDPGPDGDEAAGTGCAVAVDIARDGRRLAGRRSDRVMRKVADLLTDRLPPGGRIRRAEPSTLTVALPGWGRRSATEWMRRELPGLLDGHLDDLDVSGMHLRAVVRDADGPVGAHLLQRLDTTGIREQLADPLAAFRAASARRAVGGRRSGGRTGLNGTAAPGGDPGSAAPRTGDGGGTAGTRTAGRDAATGSPEADGRGADRNGSSGGAVRRGSRTGSNGPDAEGPRPDAAPGAAGVGDPGAAGMPGPGFASAHPAGPDPEPDPSRTRKLPVPVVRATAVVRVVRCRPRRARGHPPARRAGRGVAGPTTRSGGPPGCARSVSRWSGRVPPRVGTPVRVRAGPLNVPLPGLERIGTPARAPTGGLSGRLTGPGRVSLIPAGTAVPAGTTARSGGSGWPGATGRPRAPGARWRTSCPGAGAGAAPQRAPASRREPRLPAPTDPARTGARGATVRTPPTRGRVIRGPSVPQPRRFHRGPRSGRSAGRSARRVPRHLTRGPAGPRPSARATAARPALSACAR
jgi:hypothetical protein